jgi:hypothetical protein
MLNRALVQQEAMSDLAIRHFAMRGGALVYLVRLVWLVGL